MPPMSTVHARDLASLFADRAVRYLIPSLARRANQFHRRCIPWLYADKLTTDICITPENGGAKLCDLLKGRESSAMVAPDAGW